LVGAEHAGRRRRQHLRVRSAVPSPAGRFPPCRSRSPYSRTTRASPRSRRVLTLDRDGCLTGPTPCPVRRNRAGVARDPAAVTVQHTLPVFLTLSGRTACPTRRRDRCCRVAAARVRRAAASRPRSQARPASADGMLRRRAARRADSVPRSSTAITGPASLSLFFPPVRGARSASVD